MTPRWKTYRGTEWWYSTADMEGKATLDLQTSPPVFAIVSLEESAMWSLTGCDLAQLFRTTQSQFPEYELRCVLDPTTDPPMADLASSGEVAWEPIGPLDSPARHARVTAIRPESTAT